ncbi:MAG: HEAT repeat domain-containing protein [Deltaproteobacteria bacterium]|nr:MAG: HEAT repeat domain-containing protein [Deltaproteobacteria bacterium]
MRDETNGAGTGSEQDVSQLATAVLAAHLPAASPWMPRREMEELLRRGPDAAPPLIDVLRRAQGRGDPLWPIVVLGELRRGDAIPTLGLFLGRMEGGVNVAAAEALGKIGPPALPYLVATAAGEDRGRRLAAYGALAMIPTDEAHRRLKDALARDRALGDVIARALVQQGRPEAIAALAASAVHAPKWMRREFESAIAALVHGPVAPDPVERDWRLRYRRLPALGWNFPLTWLGVAALVHRSGPRARARAARGPLSLTLFDAITDIAARREGRPCRRCGGVYWRPAGLRVCRHTAEAMVELQAARLDRWLAAGVTDVWTALDDCDAAELRIARRGGSALQRDLVAVGRATLFWLVTIRCEDLHIGLQRLRLISNDLRDPSRNDPASPHRIPYFSPLTLRFAHVNPHNFS